MDIGSISSALSHTAIMTEVNVAVLSQSLDTVDQLGQSLINMMQQSVQPHLGQNLDITI